MTEAERDLLLLLAHAMIVMLSDSDNFSEVDRIRVADGLNMLMDIVSPGEPKFKIS